jgi:hypothetical protein
MENPWRPPNLAEPHIIATHGLAGGAGMTANNGRSSKQPAS